jgi:hypothetical protein
LARSPAPTSSANFQIREALDLEGHRAPGRGELLLGTARPDGPDAPCIVEVRPGI